MRRVLAIWLLLGAPAAAQTEASDPDWPCVQRLVPTLGAAAYWGGPEPAEGTGWRDDPAASAVVAAAAPRDVDVERGTALLQAYLAAQPPEARPAAAARAMEGLTAAINEQRGAIIERLRGLGYKGPDFGHSDPGLQERKLIVLEAPEEFAAFAKSRGWKNLAEEFDE